MQSIAHCISLSASSGAPFLFRRGKRKGGKKTAPLKRRGAYSREGPLVDALRVDQPTGAGGPIGTTVLSPHAGGCCIACPTTLHPFVLVTAIALPRKTGWGTHRSSVAYEFWYRARTALRVPDAGAPDLPRAQNRSECLVVQGRSVTVHLRPRALQTAARQARASHGTGGEGSPEEAPR